MFSGLPAKLQRRVEAAIRLSASEQLSGSVEQAEDCKSGWYDYNTSRLMNLQDAIQKAAQILGEERVAPTISYEPVSQAGASALDVLTSFVIQNERGTTPRRVRESPEQFQFKSTNFDLLCALVDQLHEHDRPALFGIVFSRMSDTRSYRHKPGPVLGTGSWTRSSSELPLVAEFVVRRGDKQRFIAALSESAASPGLTLLLIQLSEMIALNFTLFTDHEYQQIPTAIATVRRTVDNFVARAKPGSTTESNTVYHMRHELPQVCDSILEECRKARYLYVKGSLLPGMNLEINQDKDRVSTFLDKLGFSKLLIESLNQAESLYRAAATPFELKSSMGHLRSFLEHLHLDACAALHKKRGGPLPSKWGEAMQYLLDNGVLTSKEQQFAIQFYALMSDTTVHPIVAEREYARLMRNMSIDYGLLVLTKLDKLGLN
jgi:hypothetical protein